MPRSPFQAILSQGQYWLRLLSAEVCVGMNNSESVEAIGFDLEPTVDKDVFAGLTVTGRVLKIAGDAPDNDIGMKTSGRMGLYEEQVELILYGYEQQLSFLQRAFVHNSNCRAILCIITDKKIHSELRKSDHKGLAIMEWYITIHKQFSQGHSEGQ